MLMILPGYVGRIVEVSGFFDHPLASVVLVFLHVKNHRLTLQMIFKKQITFFLFVFNLF